MEDRKKIMPRTGQTWVQQLKRNCQPLMTLITQKERVNLIKGKSNFSERKSKIGKGAEL